MDARFIEYGVPEDPNVLYGDVLATSETSILTAPPVDFIKAADPVNPVELDFCSGFDHVGCFGSMSAPEFNIKIVMNMRHFTKFNLLKK